MDSGLISLLKTFSKNELKEFDKFLRSPFFTEGKNLRYRILYRYYKGIKEFYPSFNENDFSKERIYSQLYPGKEFSGRTMRKLDSDLLKMAEEFLLFNEFSADKFEQKKNLLNSLSKRSVDKIFNKRLAEAYLILDKEKLKSSQYVNRESLVSITNNFAYFKSDMLTAYNLQNEADYFFLYFLCRALELYRNMKNHGIIFNINYIYPFIDTVLAYLKENDAIFKNNPLIALHYNELMINIEKEDKYFYRLRALTKQYAGKFSETTLHNVYITMINYCTRKLNQGYKTFAEERLKLDLEIMNNNIFGHLTYVEMNVFVSTVRNASLLKKFKIAETFIQFYKNRLEPNHKSFAENYSYAILNFFKKNFDASLGCISKINIEYSNRKLEVKNLTLLIYYETKSFENALNLIDSSMHFLKNDKQITSSRKKSNLPLLRYTKELIGLNLKFDDLKYEKLRNKYQNSEFFGYKKWVGEKIEELGNSRKIK